MKLDKAFKHISGDHDPNPDCCWYCRGALLGINALRGVAAGEQEAVTPELIQEFKALPGPKIYNEFVEALCLLRAGALTMEDLK